VDEREVDKLYTSDDVDTTADDNDVDVFRQTLST